MSAARALLGGDVAQHGGVVDDHGGIGGRPGHHSRQVGEQIALDDGRRCVAGGPDGRREAFGAVPLIRPDQAGKPADVIVAGDVQGVEVEAGPPGDGGE